MLVSIAIRIRVDCNNCGDGIAVNQLTHSAKCTRCSGGRALKWKTLLRDVLARIDTVAMGTHDRAGGPAFSWQHADFWKRPAACPSCKREIASEELEPALVAGTFRCPCTVATKIRRPPADLSQIDPRIRAVFGERERARRAPPLATPSDTAAVPCRSCGAPLVLGAVRHVACGYCQADNVLSDAIWARVQPEAQAPHTPELWFMLLDTASAAASPPASKV